MPYAQLNYYSLQTAMAESAAQSTYIALAVACVVLLLVTANVLVAVYTTLTVMLIMLTVAGILYKIGWEQGEPRSVIPHTYPCEG